MTLDELRAVLNYDPKSGVFTWRRTLSNRAQAGAIAGGISAQGYRRVRVFGRLYWAHRLAWFYIHGRWPEKGVDHIDRDRSNNAISNLREATDAENMQNVGPTSRRRHGLRGVTRRGQRWIAQISVNRQTHYLGLHDTAEAAHAAYLEAKKRLHPFQPTLNEK